MRRLPLLVATVPLLLVSHSVSALAHEFGHSFMAWMLGIKANPLLITLGDASLLNFLALSQIGENVDYAAALADGHFLAVALTAATGPFIVNGGLYAWFRISARRPANGRRQIFRLMAFWFLFMNLANLYDYVPIRTFSATGDVAHICAALRISPWYVYIALFPVVVEGLADFYCRQLPRLYADLDLGGFERALMLVLGSVLMFGYFGLVGLRAGDPVSTFLSGSSLLALPFAIILFWPRRRLPQHSSGPIVQQGIASSVTKR